jgi:DNA polymerase IIIc chi subunit
LIIIENFFIWFYITDKLNKRDNSFTEKITNIELQINSLQPKKDSIRTVIDSTHIKIITNEKHYQEVVNTIISQPSSADNQFITDYIRQFRSQNNLSNIQ